MLVATLIAVMGTPSNPEVIVWWIPEVWAPVESVCLILTAICLTAALLRETEHRDRFTRFSFRIGVGCIPLAIAGAIWLFDPHSTPITIFYAGRARFWEAMAIAWSIAWLNTGWGKRMSQDGILCVWICLLRGIACSFTPSDTGQLLFRIAMSLALLSWSARYPIRGGLPALPLPPQPTADWPARSLPGPG